MYYYFLILYFVLAEYIPERFNIFTSVKAVTYCLVKNIKKIYFIQYKVISKTFQIPFISFFPVTVFCCVYFTLE